ncbi:cobalamin-dependent protein, partial [Spirochaetota bacterium]
MKYKILFIKPDGESSLKVMAIPLAPLYLSAYLKKSMGAKLEIELLDLRFIKNKERGLAEKLLQFKPDLVGVTSMTFERSSLPGIVETVKENTPEAKIVIGGPFITTNYDRTLPEIDIDCAVIGEGEVVLENLVKKFMQGKDIRSTKGIAYSQKGKVIF